MKTRLIVGLGNVGEFYANTRHNIGFKILDRLASKSDFTFEVKKLGLIATHRIKGRPVIFLKPSTYMNLSGKAVAHWMVKEKISLEHTLIITDDLNLPFGNIRIKAKGSDGGHNGLKSIQEYLHTTEYNRFRFGISKAFHSGKQADYVLGEWTCQETKALEERLDCSEAVIKTFVLEGVYNTMNTFNGT